MGYGRFAHICFGHNGNKTMDSLIFRIRELTIVDFERDSAVSEQAQLCSLLTQFMEDEARSCSMDFGCVTPQYVSRMWGGSVPVDDIAEALKEAKRQLI